MRNTFDCYDVFVERCWQIGAVAPPPIWKITKDGFCVICSSIVENSKNLLPLMCLLSPTFEKCPEFRFRDIRACFTSPPRDISYKPPKRTDLCWWCAMQVLSRFFIAVFWTKLVNFSQSLSLEKSEEFTKLFGLFYNITSSSARWFWWKRDKTWKVRAGDAVCTSRFIVHSIQLLADVHKRPCDVVNDVLHWLPHSVGFHSNILHARGLRVKWKVVF